MFGKPKYPTWKDIESLQGLWVQEKEFEVSTRCSEFLHNVYDRMNGIGVTELSEEELTLAALVCIIGTEPSGADAFLAIKPDTVENYIRNSEKCQNWAGLLIQRMYWRAEVTASGYMAPLECDFIVQEFWRGNVDVTAAGEAVCKSASGTIWDTDRNFKPDYLAGLFVTTAALEHWTDHQRTEAYHRTWQLFQWFISWCHFTAFTQHLQASE
jgi:hypothetical protein